MSSTIVSGKEVEDGAIFKIRENNNIVFKKIPFKNYFYVEEDDYVLIKNRVESLLDSVETVADKFGDVFCKLTLKSNTARGFIKHVCEDSNVETYEADVNAVRRIMTTTDISWSDTALLRVGYFDLETDDRGDLEFDFNGKVVANSVILSCAIGPKDGDEKDIQYFYNKNPDDTTIESEQELLKQIFDELNKYDVISAWNADGFDIPYLKQRQERCNLEEYFDWSFMNWLDDMLIFKKSYSQQYKSYSLDNVAKQFIGEAKIKLLEHFDEPHSKGKGMYFSLFKNEPELFKNYNIKDVRLMQMIEQQAQSYRSLLLLPKITCSFIQDIIYNSVVLDNMALAYAHKENVIFKSRPSLQEKEIHKAGKKPSGGYTFCFKKGKYNNLEVYDYKSHYPLIIMTFNISPETYHSSMSVDFEECAEFLSVEELSLMQYSVSIVKKHQNKKGDLLTSYDKAINKYIKDNNLNFTCIDVMFKFIKHYTGRKAREFALKNNLVFTPGDYNRDTNGWHFHSHVFFKRTEGIFPKMAKYALSERDKVKYAMKQKEQDNPDYFNSDEYHSDNSFQGAVKVVGNSMFGILGAPHTRFYKFDICNAITTVGRWIMKKSIVYADDKGYNVALGDTDSLFIHLGPLPEDERLQKKQDLDVEYYEHYKELFSDFNTIFEREAIHPKTGEKERLNFWCVFEHEYTYKSIIVVAKKRYYFLIEKNGEYHVKTKGGAFLKTDTNPLAAKLQKQLCYDVLTDTYNFENWRSRLCEYKEKCFNNTLDEEYLVFSKKYSKHHSNYGAPMLDGNGEQKVTKDGSPRFAPVPCHIKLVKRLEEEGRTLSVGESIDYIVKNPEYEEVTTTLKSGKTTTKLVPKSTSQEAISVDEYRRGEKYDADKYWERITSPIIEILRVVDPEKVYDPEYYGDFWNISEKMLEKKAEALEEEL